MRIKEVLNWLVISLLNKQILHVFEMSRTTHMSGGNGIRLRIMSKYNLVTYQVGSISSIIRLDLSAQPRVQTIHLQFHWPVLCCYQMVGFYLEIHSIF